MLQPIYNELPVQKARGDNSEAVVILRRVSLWPLLTKNDNGYADIVSPLMSK